MDFLSFQFMSGPCFPAFGMMWRTLAVAFRGKMILPLKKTIAKCMYIWYNDCVPGHGTKNNPKREERFQDEIRLFDMRIYLR